VRASRYLSSLVHDTDNASLKQVGRGRVYFRGMRSKTDLKAVPGDGLVFDEVDEMIPAHVELARKRLGHSALGWELYISTPTLPGYGIDKIFQASDQRHWHLKCPACGLWWCLEELFLEHHGSAKDPRGEIIFVQGEPGRENLVCVKCGTVLDPARGQWVAKHPDRPAHGYHLSKFFSDGGVSGRPGARMRDEAGGSASRVADHEFPKEFYNSELGLPYLPAEGGLTEQDLQAISGKLGHDIKRPGLRDGGGPG